jgi:hypothetical protein
MVWYDIAEHNEVSNGCVSPVGGCDHYNSVLGGAETVPFLGKEMWNEGRERMRREGEKKRKREGKRERKVGERGERKGIREERG